MTDENSDSHWRNTSNSLSPKRKRSSAFLTDSEVTNTPQVRQKRSGLLPLKRVFSRVLADLTNIVQASPTTPQSEVLNHSESVPPSIDESSVKRRRTTIHSFQKVKPNFNTSGLTGKSSQGCSSVRDSNILSNRTCSDIRPTNLFGQFSSEDNLTEKTTSNKFGDEHHGPYENEMDSGSENLDPFEDKLSQIYDISSEEEDTNSDNHSESDIESLPQQDQNVTTFPDDQRARILSVANLMKNMFQDKPAKKGWSISKRTVSKAKKKAESPKQNMGKSFQISNILSYDYC
ncbi:hypothetical protein Bca101_008686 [Brassica carinata]